MKKTNLKLFLNITFIFFGIFSLFLISLFIPNSKIIAQNQSEIIVDTTGYSVLPSNIFVFGGYYSGNIDKKPFTTYFEYKKNSQNLDTGAEETIKIVRNSNVEEFGDFYTNPELSNFANYSFRAVGYFNDNPTQKFYGNVVNLQTGYIPAGARIPFSVGGDGIATPYIPPPTLTASNITSTSVTLNATGLVSGQIYKFYIISLYGNFDSQVTANIYGLASSPFSGLKPNQTPFAVIGKYDPVTRLTTASGAPGIEVIIPPLTCTLPQVLNAAKDACVAPAPLTCTFPEILNTAKDACITPTPPVSTNPTLTTDSGAGLVPCTDKCGFDDILKLINKIVNFLLFTLAVPISAIMFAYAGFLMMVPGSESASKKQQGKDIFLNVALGLVFVAGAWLIIHTILVIAGYNTGFSWFGLEKGV